MSKKKAAKILWQSIFACLLVFGGWGFAHAPGYFGDSARAAFLVALLARNSGETLLLRASPFLTRLALGGFQRWVPLLSRLAMAFLCWFLPFADRRDIMTFSDVEAARASGLALFIAGGVVQLMALRALGQQYSVHVTLQEGHKLVRDGIYRIIRHPMYLGLFLNLVGVPLVFRSWLIFPIVTSAIFFVISRIRQEETLLSREFGSEFEIYRQRTRLILPYLC